MTGEHSDNQGNLSGTYYIDTQLCMPNVVIAATNFYIHKCLIKYILYICSMITVWPENIFTENLNQKTVFIIKVSKFTLHSKMFYSA